MIEKDILLEGEREDELASEVAFAKFHSIGKQKFNFNPAREQDHTALIKESFKFYRLRLPANINEMFIHLDDAPIFWLYKLAPFLYAENYFKAYNSKGAVNTGQNLINEFYSKWISVKSQADKKYFATSVMNAVNKNFNKHNFINHILHANIYTYDKVYFNPEKAENLYNKALTELASLNFKDVYLTEFKYYIKLYLGFLKIKAGNFDEAAMMFMDAINIKPFGVNAKFYMAYIHIQQQQQESALHLIKELYNFDVFRIDYAIDTNNVQMLDYFAVNSIIKNIFYFHEFIPLKQSIEDFIVEVEAGDSNILKTMKKNLDTFGMLHSLIEYITEEVISNVSFLGNMVHKYTVNENLFIKNSINSFKTKFNNTVNIIYDAIKQKYYNEVTESLKIYDAEVAKCMGTIERLQNDLEKYKEDLKKDREKSLEKLEEYVEEKLKNYEKRIRRLPSDPNLDPRKSFNNTITYDIILSLIVLIIGIFASYSSDPLSGIFEFSYFMKNIVLSGLKWAVVTFIVGMIVAVVSAGSTYFERTRLKQHYNDRINEYKNLKKSEAERIKNSSDKKEKSVSANYKRRIDEQNRSIEGIKADKDKQDKELRKIADEKIAHEAEELLPLIIED